MFYFFILFAYFFYPHTHTPHSSWTQVISKTKKKKEMNELNNIKKYLSLIYFIFIQKWHTNKRKTKNKHLHEWNFQGLLYQRLTTVQSTSSSDVFVLLCVAAVSQQENEDHEIIVVVVVKWAKFMYGRGINRCSNTPLKFFQRYYERVFLSRLPFICYQNFCEKWL